MRSHRDYLLENDVAVGFSLDGPPEVQDLNRPVSDGRPSFSRVMEAIVDYRKHSGSVPSIRATYCRDQPRSIVQVIDFFLSQGLNRIAIKAAGGTGSCSFSTHQDFDLLLEHDRAAVRKFLEDNNNQVYYEYVKVCDPVKALYRRAKIVRPCGGGIGLLTTTPNGEFFCCHRLAGNPVARIGDIESGISEEVRMRFLENSVLNREKCTGCWARFLCGGSASCMYQSAITTGDLFSHSESACYYIKKYWELVIWLYSELPDEDKRRLGENRVRRVEII